MKVALGRGWAGGSGWSEGTGETAGGAGPGLRGQGALGKSEGVWGELQSLKLHARTDQSPAGSKRGLCHLSGREGSWSQCPWFGSAWGEGVKGFHPSGQGGQQRLVTMKASETEGVAMSHGHQGSSPPPTRIFSLFLKLNFLF